MLAIIEKTLRSATGGKWAATLIAWGVAAQTAGGVTLAWDPSPDSSVAGYVLHYGTVKGVYSVHLDVARQTTATVASLTPGATYFFVATAYTSDRVESLPSNEVSYTAPQDTPSKPANQSPQVIAGADCTAALLNNLTLNGSVSDDGLPVVPGRTTASWSLISGPGSALFQNTNALNTTVVFSKVGDYVLRLTATDGEFTAWDDLTVTVVTANTAPVVSAGPGQRVALLESLTLGGSVFDDGLPTIPGRVTVSWALVSGPGSMAFQNASSLTTTVTFSKVGTYVLRLTATDGALAAWDDVSITVSPANSAPVVEAGSDQDVTLPNGLTLSGTVSDDGLPATPGRVTVSWALVSGPGSVAFQNANSLSTTASFSKTGTYVLRLTATDGALSAFEDVTVSVTPANIAPVVNAGPDQNISLPDVLTLSGNVTDDGLPDSPGNVSTAWALLSGPSLAAIQDTNALNTTVSFTQAGVYVLRLTATDGGLTTSDDVTITVSPANTAPVVNAGLDQNATLPNSLTLTGAVSDDGLPTVPGRVAVSWELASGPGSVMFQNANALTTPATFSKAGIYVLRLTATDGALSAFDDVTVSVSPANTVPVVNAGPDQGITLPDSLNLNGSVSDDGLPAIPGRVTASWALVSGPGSMAFQNASSLTSTVTFSKAGLYVLRLTATDGALSAFDDVAVSVSPVNAAPVANAGPDQSVTLPDSVTLNGNATDDGVPASPGSVSASWVLVSGPGSVVFQNANALTTPATFPKAGIYVLRLTATDGALSAFDDVAVSVSPANTAPVVNAGPDQSVTLPDSITLNGSATDDGVPARPGSVSASWALASGPGSVILQNTNALTTSATFSKAGIYVLRLTATDGALSAFDDVTVSVSPVNTAPIVNAGPDQSVTLPNSLTLNGNVSDDGFPATPGRVAASWALVSGPGSMAFQNASSLTSTVTFSKAGIYVLRLTAADGALSAFDDVTISVTPANTPPVVNAGADQSLTLPDSLTLNGSVSDDGLPISPGRVTASWALVGGPGSMAFQNANSLTTTVTFSKAGTYVLRLTVTDGALATWDDVSVSVHPANTAPIVHAGDDQTLTLPDSVILSGSAADDGWPENPGEVQLSWTVVDGPSSVNFDDPNAPITTARFSVAGTYVLRLTATDGALSAFDDVAVSVSPANTAPVVNAGTDAALTLPASLTLNGSFSDDGLPDGNNNVGVVWSVVSGPGPVVFDDPNTLSTTASFSLGGSYVLRLTANDGELESYDDVTVTAKFATPQVPLAVVIEAESGSIRQPMSVTTTSDSGAQSNVTCYIVSPVSGQGSASYDVPISVAGSYVVWARVQVPADTSASFYIAGDNTAERVVQVAEETGSDTWRWICLYYTPNSGIAGVPGGMPAPLTLKLETGYHTLTVRSGNNSVAFDKFIVTNDRNFVPADLVIHSAPSPTISNLSFAPDGARVTWSTVAGATYRLVYKDNLGDAQWLPASPDLIATSTQLTWLDETAGATSRRFFAAVLVR